MPRVRFWVLFSVIILAYGFLLWKVYDLQLTKGKYYLAKAQSQYEAAGILKKERGTIYFRDKDNNYFPAATGKDFPLIYAVPKVIDDPEEAANVLSPVLSEPVESLIKKFSKKDDLYELLLRRADKSVAQKVEELNIGGVYITLAKERFYPFGKLASHILGFVGPSSEKIDESGHYGLEEFYDEKLSGEPFSRVGNKIIPPEGGEDLFLTIDLNIQIEAEKILAGLVEKWRAKGGSVIVQNPETGKILAMASYPNFDPNNYKNAKISDFVNPAIQRIYEPGSVFKLITMAAGIDSGKITPDTKFYDKGSLIVNDKKIQNWDLKSHGWVTMTQVLEKSINTGAAFAEKEMGHNVFKDYVQKFGFGKKSGIDFVGELAGDTKRLFEPRPPAVLFATASFGQGIAVTPLQVINAISAIANGGKLMRPYFNAALNSEVIGYPIKPEAAKAVTEMMVSAVDKAEVAKIQGYSIAGKTGTAQVPDFKVGGYTDKVINSYVGFGPATNPRFTILIKLDEPEGAPVAALTVVPAFRDLAQFILNYYNVPPDRL